ncbi:hypothetical protein EW146_g8105 [Bondarzewia mesenterica]|uniref:t-SNARE coiled-coil homology domain-containing protein n=1 Tax=Bondarzewia mesenterica TaxID=1095465 RepID=A0A4S4LIS4_9AGAM|nr:hypothetical protein EW146_g8105 [Bondarzewia mesenterica]
MSSSRSQEDTLETQNDQRLDELHSKIRTLRGVTTDIHDDVERQNLVLDETSNTFTSFGNSLTASASRMTRSLSPGSITALRIAAFVPLYLDILALALIFVYWSNLLDSPSSDILMSGVIRLLKLLRSNSIMHSEVSSPNKYKAQFVDYISWLSCTIDVACGQPEMTSYLLEEASGLEPAPSRIKSIKRATADSCYAMSRSTEL